MKSGAQTGAFWGPWTKPGCDTLNRPHWPQQLAGFFFRRRTAPTRSKGPRTSTTEQDHRGPFGFHRIPPRGDLMTPTAELSPLTGNHSLASPWIRPISGPIPPGWAGTGSFWVGFAFPAKELCQHHRPPRALETYFPEKNTKQRAQTVGFPGLATPPLFGAKASRNSGTVASISSMAERKHPEATGPNIIGCNHLEGWFSHGQNTQVQEEAVTSKQLPRLQGTTHWESLAPSSTPVNPAVRRSHGRSSTALKAEPSEASTPALAGEGNSGLQRETELCCVLGEEGPWPEPRDAKAWLSIPISKS